MPTIPAIASGQSACAEVAGAPLDWALAFGAGDPASQDAALELLVEKPPRQPSGFVNTTPLGTTWRRPRSGILPKKLSGSSWTGTLCARHKHCWNRSISDRAGLSPNAMRMPFRSRGARPCTPAVLISKSGVPHSTGDKLLMKAFISRNTSVSFEKKT